MFDVIWLINLVFQAATYLIFGSVILSVVGHTTRGRWLYHPAVQLIIRGGDALCRPFRELMRRSGVNTGPLDFSPMIAVMALHLAQRLLLGLL